jgi:L-threonylcarbamoyladenylate synthase
VSVILAPASDANVAKLFSLVNELVSECRPATPEATAQAIECLRGGGLVIVPTDTVYGIAADIRRPDAVLAIYDAKGRGRDIPLQLLFAPGSPFLDGYAVLAPAARTLIEALGPGGWTIVTGAAPGWESPALAGGRTVGVRVPDAPVVRALVEGLGAPLAATSANRHGAPSPTTCAEAVASVGAACTLALDGGPTPHGLDSTVIDCSGAEPRILREGAVDRGTVARILGLRDIPVIRSIRS